MGKYCSAFNCNNNSNSYKKKEGVTFHRFPLKDKTLLQQWLVQIGRKGFVPNKYSFLCKDHFTDEDFVFYGNTVQRRIKIGAVPSKFAHTEDAEPRPCTSHEFGASAEATDSTKSQAVQTDLTGDEIISLLKKCQDNDQEIQKLRDAMRIRDDEAFSIDKVKDESLKDLTGFKRLYIDTIFSFFMLDKELETKTRPHTLSPINQLFLTLIKIRQGITMRVLSLLFKKNQSTVNRIFNRCISILYTKAFKIDFWPPKFQVQAYMPLQFHQHFPSCRVIIDATEFYIQKSTNPTRQQASFSNYKNYNTLKALIGITPGGAISFISDLWLGGISDKELTIRSGLLEKLERGDTVLADRGFTSLQGEFDKRGISLFTPTFLRDKIQFPLEERGENKRISSHRCHVERAIGRIKMFKILDGVIPFNIKNVEDIYYVCAFLCNFLESPLINVETLSK